MFRPLDSMDEVGPLRFEKGEDVRGDILVVAECCRQKIRRGVSAGDLHVAELEKEGVGLERCSEAVVLPCEETSGQVSRPSPRK